MKFASLIFFAAFAVAVNTIDMGTQTVEEPTNPQPLLVLNVRMKRMVGVDEERRKDIEIHTKNDGSTKVLKSNDGGALTLLPAVMDTAVNDSLRVLNEPQNGQGTSELTNSTIAGASSSSDSANYDIIDENFNADDTSSEANDADDDPDRILYNPRPITTTTTTTVNPIIAAGVCCGQVQPMPGRSYIHSLLKKHLEKSIIYHRRKSAYKQQLLDDLVAKQPTTVGALVPDHSVHTPDCDHQNGRMIGHDGLHQLIAYRHEAKAKKIRAKLAAIHAKMAIKKCHTCCCNN